MRKLLTLGVIVLASPVLIVGALYAVMLCDRSTIALWSEDE